VPAPNFFANFTRGNATPNFTNPRPTCRPSNVNTGAANQNSNQRNQTRLSGTNPTTKPSSGTNNTNPMPPGFSGNFSSFGNFGRFGSGNNRNNNNSGSSNQGNQGGSGGGPPGQGSGSSSGGSGGNPSGPGSGGGGGSGPTGHTPQEDLLDHILANLAEIPRMSHMCQRLTSMNVSTIQHLKYLNEPSWNELANDPLPGVTMQQRFCVFAIPFMDDELCVNWCTMTPVEFKRIADWHCAHNLGYIDHPFFQIIMKAYQQSLSPHLRTTSGAPAVPLTPGMGSTQRNLFPPSGSYAPRQHSGFFSRPNQATASSFFGYQCSNDQYQTPHAPSRNLPQGRTPVSSTLLARSATYTSNRASLFRKNVKKDLSVCEDFKYDKNWKSWK
jgi:hypothetical protein